MPGRKSNAAVSHSVIHSEFAPPLTLDLIHSGWYFEARGKRFDTSRLSDVTLLSVSHSARFGDPVLTADSRVAFTDRGEATVIAELASPSNENCPLLSGRSGHTTANKASDLQNYPARFQPWTTGSGVHAFTSTGPFGASGWTASQASVNVLNRLRTSASGSSACRRLASISRPRM